MRKLSALLLMLVCLSATGLLAQNITVNPGAGSYATLKDAFDAVNAGTHTGAVTIDVVGNTVEVASAVLNASGSGSASYSSIIIRPSGGSSRTISGAIVAGSPLIDLNGADNVTIDGLNSGGNSLEISNTTVSATTGTSTIRFIADATSNTVTNCSVLGSATVPNATNGGNIYFATATTTGNDNNTISNCNIGPAGANLPTKAIYANGTTTSSTTCNSGITISNNNIFDYFLTGGCAGIYATTGNTEWSITNNRIYQTDTRTFTAAGTMYGIYYVSATHGDGIQITGNTVGYSSNSQTGTLTLTGTVAGAFIGIQMSVAATTTADCNLNNNTVSDISLTSSTGVCYGVYNSTTGTTANTINVNNNIVRNISTQTSTGLFYGIWWTSAQNISISNNQVYNLTRNGAGTTYGIFSGSSSVNEIVNNNTVYNLSNTASNSTTITLRGIYQLTAAGIKRFTNNTVYNLTIPNSTATANVLEGLRVNYGTTDTISGNTIYALSGVAGTLAGIGTAGTTTSATYYIFKNKIYDLTSNYNSSTAGFCTGIIISGGTSNTYNIFNNLIGDINAPNASNTDAIRGISFTITSTNSTLNTYFNTIYLNATSVGANFGTSGIYHTYNTTATTANLTLRNNMVYNSSTSNGTGLTVAFRRSAATNLNNFNAASDRNLYYAGTPGASNLIFSNGTNNFDQLVDYQTFMSGLPADQNSQTADINFQSTTGASADFLKFSVAAPSIAESRGENVAGITDDYAGNIRQGNPGYVGSGVAPDIGAWELNGMISGGCSGTPSASNALTDNATPCNGADFTLSLSFTYGLGISYQWEESTTGPSSGFSPIAGATEKTLLTNTNVTKWYRAVITCAISGLSTASASVQITIATPLAGSYLIDNSGAGDYLSFEAALIDLNCKGVGAPVTFNVRAGQTFAETANLMATFPGTSTNTITFQRFGAGANPIITRSGTTATTDYVFQLNGVDYYTFDGIDFEQSGTAAADWVEYGVMITNASATNGAKNNTIKNGVISLTASTTSTRCVYVQSSPTPTDLSGTNSNNRFLNMTLQNSSVGYYITGASNTYPDDGNEINTEGGGNSFVQNLGNGTTSPSMYGVYASYQTNFKLKNTEISNFNNGGTGLAYAIYLPSSTANSAEISNNQVHDISGGGTLYGLYVAAGDSVDIFNNQFYALSTTTATNSSIRGIYVSATNIKSNIYNNRVSNISSAGLTTTTSSGIDVATGLVHNIVNNMVSGITAPASTTTTAGTKGISISGGTSGGIVRVYYNTVLLSDVSTASAYTSAALHNASASPTLDIRNNIFINNSDISTGTRVAAFWKTANTDNVDDASNNNLYYAGSPDASHLIYYNGTTSAQTLNDYKAVTEISPAENLSLTENVVFAPIVNGVLRPAAATPTLVESSGKIISGYTTDFENDARGPYPIAGQANGGGLNPDLGADEGDYTYIVPPVPGCATLTEPTDATTDVCFFNTITLKWNASTTGGLPTGGYDVYFGANSNPPFVGNTSALSYDVTGLVENTVYYWKIVPKNGTGPAAGCTTYSFATANIAVTSTTPASRCGTGTVDLGVSGAGTFNWYAVSTGGAPIGTGPTFTTPSISTTTDFYVAASSGGISGSVGAPNAGGTSGYTLEAGLLFDVTAPTMTLNGVYIYPVGTGAGTVNIALKNSGGTTLESISFACTGTTAPGIKTFVPLNWIVLAGSGYLLDMTSRTGNVASLTRDGTADIVGGPFGSNPNMTLPGVMTITSGQLSGSGTSTSYYFFYDWQVSTGCESPRTAVTATVNPDGTWNGMVSTDWNNAGNWCGGLPGPTDNVIIPNVANKPILASAVTVNNLTINAGSSVTLNGQALNVSGSLAGTGVLIGSPTSELTINGAGALGTINLDQTTDGTTNALANFTFNRSSGTATLGNKLVVINTYTPSAGTLTSGGNLYLRSTAAQTARIAQGSPAGGYLIGDVMVERYIPAVGNRAWRLLSAPVSSTGAPTIFNSWQEGGVASSMGTHITQNGGTGSNGFDASSIALNGSSIRAWDGASLITPSATTLPITNNGGAYFLFVRGNRNIDLNNASSNSNTTLRMTGAVNQGPVTAGIAGTSFSLIPNPYPSPVDYEAIIAANGGLSGTYYVWDATMGSVGAYRTVVRTGASTYSSTPTTGSDNTMRYIRSGQAFFIPDNMQINFTEVMKTEMLPAINVYRPGTGTEEMTIDLKVVDANGTAILYDGVRAKYNNSFSASVDNKDAPKLNNFNENMSIVRDSKSLAVETRPLVDAADTIFLKLWNTGIKNYQFDINPANFSSTASLDAYLVDNYLNTNTPVSLSANTLYDFSITSNTASAAADRFMIVFRPATTLPANFTNVKAYQKNSGIQVEWNVGTEQDVVKYEVEKSTNGTSFDKAGTVTGTNSKAYNWFDAMPNNGANFYRIKVVNKDNTYSYSNVVNVKLGNTSGDIAVYPNPVKGNVINIQINNLEKGTYNVQLINSLGQQVYKGKIVHNGGSSSEALQLSSTLSKGAYQLVITNGSYKITQQVISE